MTSGLFAVGDCPVCADSGAVVVLRARGTETFVYFCPLCGVAWRTPPSPRELNAVLTLREVAPDGVEIPDRDAVTGVSNVHELDSYWIVLLKRVLADESRREAS